MQLNALALRLILALPARDFFHSEQLQKELAVKLIALHATKNGNVHSLLDALHKGTFLGRKIALEINARRAVGEETLLARVWGYDTEAVDNHVEVYVAFLRKKLKNIGSNIHIEAVRRMGYHLEVYEQ